MKREVRFQHALAELELVSADVGAELVSAEENYVVNLEVRLRSALRCVARRALRPPASSVVGGSRCTMRAAL